MARKPCIIICERSGQWAAGLRRHLSPELRVRETRGLGECRRELAAAPASLVVVEVTQASLDGALGMLVLAGRRFPLARVVAVAPRGCEGFEWLLREAGAIHFTTSPRESGVLARVAERHAARVPTPRTGYATQIWDSLPWREAASR